MHYNKDSESLANITNAFRHEASGHVRYKILTDNAESKGEHGLAALYRQLADEELAHARNWYRQLNGEEESNALQNSLDAEEKQYKYRYPRMAAKAELEGYEQLADMFNATGNIEGDHSRMIRNFLDSANNAADMHEDVVWRCRICGNTHIDKAPPVQCPLCGYNATAYNMLKE